VLHLDIKPENILLAVPAVPGRPLQLKIGDFGLAVVSSRWEVQEGAPAHATCAGP
jgi:serine/threonine protein kinase